MDSSRLQVQAIPAGNCHPSKCTKAAPGTHFAHPAEKTLAPPDSSLSRRIGGLSDRRVSDRLQPPEKWNLRDSGNSRSLNKLLSIWTVPKRLPVVSQRPKCANDTIPPCRSDRSPSTNNLTRASYVKASTETMPAIPLSVKQIQAGSPGQELVAPMACVLP